MIFVKRRKVSIRTILPNFIDLSAETALCLRSGGHNGGVVKAERGSEPTKAILWGNQKGPLRAATAVRYNYYMQLVINCSFKPTKHQTFNRSTLLLSIKILRGILRYFARKFLTNLQNDLAQQILYIITLLLSKSVIIFLYLRLSPARGHKLANWGTLAVSTFLAHPFYNPNPSTL